MAWNEPGNKGKDPWGNKSGNDKGPPDLDEVFKNLSKKFGGKETVLDRVSARSVSV